MNRPRSIVITIVLLSTILVMTANAQDDTVEYIVTGSSANVRSGPGTEYPVIGVVYQGDIVEIDAASISGSSWFEIVGFDGSDTTAYIADFLVEPAPMRWYADENDPITTISGRGRTVSEIVDLPRGLYRLDATVNDRSFILSMIVVEGNCDDTTVFNELDFDRSTLVISGLVISAGCSIIFETDNVSGQWEFSIRDLVLDTLMNSLSIVDGTRISGAGRTLTMATQIPAGLWTVQATVDDRAFILHPRTPDDCEGRPLFNELDLDARQIVAEALYRVPADGCIVWWETENVQGNWVIVFSQLR